MAFQRIDGAEPLRPDAEGRLVHEELRPVASPVVARGTLACPSCDAPVALGEARVGPADPIDCPFCDHHGLARDYLSLRTPGRPARVVVRLVIGSGVSLSGR